MKPRPEGFLSEGHIAHDSEQFDYIRELHEYLWRFVRAEIPGASGDLTDFVDAAVILAEHPVVKEAFDSQRALQEASSPHAPQDSETSPAPTPARIAPRSARRQ